MKAAMKAALILVAMLFLIGMAINYVQAKKKDTKEEIEGRYYSQDYPEYYLELRRAKVYSERLQRSLMGRTSTWYNNHLLPPEEGEWLLEKDKIYVSTKIAWAEFLVKGNGVIEGGQQSFGGPGPIWIKEGTRPSFSQKEVSGAYTCYTTPTIFGPDGLMFRPDGKCTYTRPIYTEMVKSINGTWKIEEDRISAKFDETLPLLGVQRTMVLRALDHNILIQQGRRWMREIKEEPIVTEPATKPADEQLVESLKELKDVTLKKIDWDVDNVAQTFTAVKTYWRVKRWADIFGPVLHTIQDILSIAARITTSSDLTTQVNQVLDSSKATYEVVSLGLMVQGVYESAGKLRYGISGPSYFESIKQMLDKADDVNPPLKFEAERYKQVIKNHLYGSAEGKELLIVPHLSTTIPREKTEFVNGTLLVRKRIAETFDRLIAEIKSSPLPQDFPARKVIAQIHDLKIKVTESTSKEVDIRYQTYLLDKGEYRSSDVEIKLGQIGQQNKRFVGIAGAVAEKLTLEERVEVTRLIKTGTNLLQITITSKIPGMQESVQITQQAVLIPEIVIKGKILTFHPKTEQQFYMSPQEMLLSLPNELTNLWMVVDDLNQYLRYLLSNLKEKDQSDVEGKDWKEHKLGALYFSLPSDWNVLDMMSLPKDESIEKRRREAVPSHHKILELEGSYAGTSTQNYLDKKHIGFIATVTEAMLKDAESGKTCVAHYDLTNDYRRITNRMIEEPGIKPTKTITVGHFGRLVDSFTAKIAGLPLTVCVLHLTEKEGFLPKGFYPEGTVIPKLSFALFKNGKHYVFELTGVDSDYLKAICKEIISRMRLTSKKD